MPQALITQKAFNSGELSPLALARSDTGPYKNALGACRNMIPLSVGPVVKRPGSRYVAPVADESKNSRLIPFTYSDVASYVLELADEEIRIFTPAGVGGWLLPPTVTFSDDRIDLTLNTIGINDAHYFQDGAGPFRIKTDDTLPDPLAIDTDYYIVLTAASAGAASFALSLTPGGAAVVLTDKGTNGAEHQLIPQPQVIQAIDSPYTIEEIWAVDFVSAGDILYLTHQNHPPQQLERRTANGFRLREVFFIDGPWDEINVNLANSMDPSPGPVALTQSEPHDFPPADVALSAGDGDTPAWAITIPNHGYEDRQGPLEFHTTGTLPNPIVADTPYFVNRINDHQFTLAASAGGAAIQFTTRGTGIHTLRGRGVETITMLADTFEDPRDLFRRFRYRETIATSGQPEWAWGIIDEITDAKTAVVQVHRLYSGDNAQSVFRLGAFYQGNYPALCHIHEQRLWLAATPSHPNALYASQIGDFVNFGPDEGIEDYNDSERVVTDAASINYSLGSGQVDKLAFLASVRQLIVGTKGAVWPIQANSLLEALTPANINSRPSSVLGSATLRPAVVSDEVVYLSASTHKLLAIGFDFERDSFVPQDLSILASHFTEKPITQMAFANEPNSVLWCTRNDGLLIGVTYERAQRVLGWHGHTMGGTDSKVNSVAVVADDDQSYDQLWMIVERTIGGSTRRYIEFLESPFYTDTALEDAAFLDSSPVPYDDDVLAIDQVTGLDHLEGDLVYALADGVWYGDLEVIGGTINLPVPANKIRVGLNFNAYIKTLPLEADGAPGGPLSSRMKSVKETYIDVHRTNYVQVGVSLDEMVEIALRDYDDPPEGPVPLESKIIDVFVDHGLSIDQAFYVGSDKPVPLDIIGLTGRVEWSQR
jgi:hypothetical protein